MGMSATQARFLSLTARKSNVEFEGQQINQQRTTLSNESASYYSELCNMEVPTPPSVDDYTNLNKQIIEKYTAYLDKWIEGKTVQEELYNVLRFLYYRPASLYIFHRRIITSISDSLSVQKSSE